MVVRETCSPRIINARIADSTGSINPKSETSGAPM
jgi:hypothetical protein